MATNKEELFNKVNGSKWNTGVVFERTNPGPIEKYSVFQTLADAQTYASTNAVAYVGQIITVVGGTETYTPWSFSDSQSHTMTYTDGYWYMDGVKTASKNTYDLSATATISGTPVTATRQIETPYTITPYKIIDTSGTLQKVDMDIPYASKSDYGIVKIGDGLDVQDGVISVETISVDQDFSNISSKNPVSTKAVNDHLCAMYVDNSTFTTWKNETGLSAAGVGEDTQIVLRKDIKGITGVMHFRGAGAFDDTLSNLATWAETSATLYANTTYYKSNVPTEGDFVIKTGDSTEFVFNGDSATGYWAKLGDEQLYLKKSEFETWRDTTLEDRLSTIETKETEISSKTDNKVKVGTYGSELQNKDSLSVVKILDEDYYKLIAEGKQDNDVLYVVSVDHLNGFDQRVTNVGNPLSATDAVNLSTMQYAVQQVKDSAISAIQINGQSFDIANNVASIQITCINCGGAF